MRQLASASNRLDRHLAVLHVTVFESIRIVSVMSSAFRMIVCRARRALSTMILGTG